MARVRIAASYVGPAALAGAKLGNNTHEYAIAHAFLEPTRLRFQDGDTVLATFTPASTSYDAALRRYVVKARVTLADLDRDYLAAAAPNLHVKFRLHFYDFFLQVVKHMSYAVADNHNFADPPDEDAITNAFASVAQAVNPTDADWTVTFRKLYADVKMPALRTAWTGTGASTARMGLRLRSDDMVADQRMNLLHYLIAADWSAYYDDFDHRNRETTVDAPWKANLKAFMLRYLPLTRGATLITRAKTLGWTACQTARDNGLLDNHERQQNTILAVRNEIDRFLITANPWGDDTNTGAYPSAVHIALAALYKRFRATPIGLVRKTLTNDITAADKMNMVAQMGMGNCAEHANITFKVIKDMMTEQVDAQAMLRCVVRTGYLNIDHAFVTGGERPARIVNALLRQDHKRGRSGARVSTWDSYAAYAGAATPGRRGWICDPYLAAGGIPETFAGLASDDRRRQWLTWRGDNSIYPAGAIATARDATNAATAGHIHIPLVCDQTAPAITSIDPAYGPIGGGTDVTFTGTHFDSRFRPAFGTAWGTNPVFTDSTTAVGRTPARAAGAVRAAIVNCDNVDTYVGDLADAFTYCDPPTFRDVRPALGAVDGGTAVTIRGTNFVVGHTTVDFGGTPATNVNVTAANRLTADTPARPAAGRVTVSVTTPGGTVDTVHAYRYKNRPAITDIDPDFGSTEGGTVVTISGNNFEAGAQVIFDQDAVHAIYDPRTGNLRVVTPRHARGSVNVIVVNPDRLGGGLRDAFDYRQPQQRRRF